LANVNKHLDHQSQEDDFSSVSLLPMNRRKGCKPTFHSIPLCLKNVLDHSTLRFAGLCDCQVIIDSARKTTVH